MDKINIRKAVGLDVANLAVLKQQVWIATYADEGIRSEFSEYVLEKFRVENIRAEMLESNRFVYISEIDEHLVGCVEMVFEPDGAEIDVLYVLERFTGKGIGKMLLEKAIRICKDQGLKRVWLTVYHENERAIQFYLKNGFRESGKTYFEMGGNRYLNLIMNKVI